MSGNIPAGYLHQLYAELISGVVRLKEMAAGSAIRFGDDSSTTISLVHVTQVEGWVNGYVAAAFGGTNSNARFEHIDWSAADPRIERVAGALLFRPTIERGGTVVTDVYIAISDTQMMRAVMRS